MTSPTDRRREPRYAGEIAVEGALIHVWVFACDPRWREICTAEYMAEKPGKPGKRRPKPMTSQHAPGRGRWFLSRYVDAFTLSPDQRLQMASIASSHDEILRRAAAMIVPGAREGEERSHPENYRPGPTAHPQARYLSADQQRLLLKLGKSQRLSWLGDLATEEAFP